MRLLHSPGWLGLVLLAAALLVGSVVAPALFHASARGAALEAGVEAAAAEPAPGASADLRASWTGVLRPRGAALVRDRLLDLPGYGAPTAGAAGTAQDRRLRAVVRAGGESLPGALFFHDGVLEALGADADAPGAWLPTDLAEGLGLAVGDRFRVGLQSVSEGSSSTRFATTTLSGTYATAPRSVLPAAVAAAPGSADWVLPIDPGRPGEVSQLVVTSPATFGELVRAIDEEPLYAADLRVDAALDADTAEDAVAGIQRLAIEAFDSTTDLAQVTDQARPLPTRLELASGLPDILVEAQEAAVDARDQVGPYAAAGQVLAAALLAAAWVLVGRSRRREESLAAGLGVHPLAVAGLTVLELLPLAVLALPFGTALALLAVDAAGPPYDLGPGDLTRADLLRAGVGAAVALALPAAVALAAALRADLGGRGRLGARVRSVPWEALVLVATAVVLVGVLSQEPARRAGSPLTTALPLLVAASAAAVVVRLAALVRLPGARPGGARWLASRRAGSAGPRDQALTAVLAVTLGLFAYTLAVHRGLVEGADDKAAALVGAPTAASVDDALRGTGVRALRPPVEDSTLVWRQRVTLPPTFGAQQLLAVDAETFAAVADWGSTGTLEGGRDLLDRLDDPTAELVPVLLAGDTDLAVGDRGTLEINEEVGLGYVVAGVLPAFPGSEAGTGDAAVVVSARQVFPLLPPPLDPRDPLSARSAAGAFGAEVWSRADADRLDAQLEAVGLSPVAVSTTRAAEVGEGLLAASWAARYVVVLGLVVLLLALATVLALGLRLADRDAVADVLLAQMGYRPRELAAARTWEVARAVLTAAVATVVSTAALVLGPSLVDQVPQVLPTSRPRLGATEAGAVVGLALAMVAAASAVGLARARRRSGPEVLRGNG